MTTVLCVDLGASSGRAVLLSYENNLLSYEEVYRFSDYLVNEGNQYFWDFDKIMSEIKIGIRKAARIKSFVSIGVDTWGVDFGLLDSSGRLVANPFSYRNWRGQGILECLAEKIDLFELYRKTGTQILPINSIFQLAAIKKEYPDLYKTARSLLFMPDLINYFLTSQKYNELTEVSTSQMMNQEKKDWAVDMIAELGLSSDLLLPIIQPKQKIGELTDAICEECQISTKDIIAVGSHDTASAIFSIPFPLKECLFISSGTWSLIGISVDEPVVNDQTFEMNLSNEIGVDTHLLLQNITGLWLIQELKKVLTKEYEEITFSEINQFASKDLANGSFYFDVNDSRLMEPDQLINVLKQIAIETDQQLPESLLEYASIIYENLAYQYRYSYEKMLSVGIQMREKIVIVGGGANASFLCQLTANVLQMPVFAGLIEATAIGNGLCQLIAREKIKDKSAANQLIQKSFGLEEYYPKDEEKAGYDKKYQEYITITRKVK